MTEREFAIDVVRKLRDAGHIALWAGGCVRDLVLGREPDDFDIATDARPDRVQSLFRHTFAVGASFGVIEVLGPKQNEGYLKVQVATFRSDGDYSDGRRPDQVVYSSPEEDAQRRDFTINGMFFDPLNEKIIDYVGGEADLKQRVLRAIGDPIQRFTEDKLRLLRAVRFAARLDMKIDPATHAAVRTMARQLSVVSAERIAEELRKLLVHPTRAVGMRFLQESSLLPHAMPESSALSIPQFHEMLRTLEHLGGSVTPPLAFAATIYSADGKAAQMLGERLKLSNAERDRTGWLVHNSPRLMQSNQMPPSQLKPILAHPGIQDLLQLNRAIAAARNEPLTQVEYCELLLRQWPPEVLDPPPLLTGDDLVALGWKPGRQFKTTLDAVRARQLDGELTTREDAIEFARRSCSAG